MVHSTPLPAQLPGSPLSDREAVADACYRAFLSIDQADVDLLMSSVTEDVHTDIANKECHGVEELKSKVWENVSYRLDTIHYLNNMRVSIDTEDTARVTFCAMAVHCQLGKGYDLDEKKFTTGAIYNCDAVKVDGLWKLKMMKSNHVWADGDPSIMAPH
ncbi:hypothetical protein ANO11243_007750 [Dothideomycetidae sp. 11243]|nr:hypothetical protein ANO11243_007750 [fungal sp. No.11243]